MTTTNPEKISIAIYNRYGSFELPEKGRKLYQKITGTELDCEKIKRHDENLIAVLRSLHSVGECSSICIEEIPYEMKNFYTIRDYDGIESIKINHGKFARWKLTEITESTLLTSDQKIEEIKSILKKYPTA